jgi:Zn-dependent protease
MSATDERTQVTGPPPGLRVGQVLGVPVYLHPSWFVITALITVLYTGRYSALGLPELSSAGAFGAGLAAAGLLLLSVFLHELSHAAVARRLGSPPTHITLDLWGGHTGFAAEQPSPATSALVSAVGPATNALLGAVGWTLRDPAMHASVVLGLLVYGFTYTNLFVAVFNALPGLPLDGGRVLEAIVWLATGDRPGATIAAGRVGRLVALAVAGLAVAAPLLQGQTPSVVGILWLGLVAVMLWRSAGAAIGYARWQRRTGSITLADLMDPAVTVPAAATLAEALAAAEPAGTVVLLAGPDGGVTAVLDRAVAAAVPLERHREVPAAAVAMAIPATAVLPVAAAGTELLALLQADPQPRYLVVDEAGDPVGLLPWHSVADRVGTV